MVQNGVIHLDGFPLAQDPNGELRRHWRHRNAAIDQRRITYIRSLEFPQPRQWDEDDKLSPDTVLLMMASEQRPGVPIARADLWFDYGSNVKRYPEWQAMLKRLQPPTLVIWGSRDDFFTVPGAVAYLKEVPRAEVHILDTVHFATLEEPGEVARIILDFLARHPLAAPGAHQARMLPAG